MTIKQAIGIPMGIDPDPFLGNPFSSSNEEECMSSLISSDRIKARHVHSTRGFIDDLYAIDNGGEFGGSIYDIYLKELEVKVKHQGDHATLLNLDITLKKGTFIYKLFDKRETPFPLHLSECLIQKAIPFKFFSSRNQRLCF